MPGTMDKLNRQVVARVEIERWWPEVMEKTEDVRSDWMRGAVVQRLCSLLEARYPQYVAAPELDVRVEAWVRRPDLAVQKRELVDGLYADRSNPLWLVAEVLSAGGKTFASAVFKAGFYARWGVQHVWVLDAHKRECWSSSNGFETPVAQLEAGEIVLKRDEVFDTLDRIGPTRQ
jgi:hypothetical protein